MSDEQCTNCGFSVWRQKSGLDWSPEDLCCDPFDALCKARADNRRLTQELSEAVELLRGCRGNTIPTREIDAWLATYDRTHGGRAEKQIFSDSG